MSTPQNLTKLLTKKDSIHRKASDLAPLVMRRMGTYVPQPKPEGTVPHGLITNASMRETYKTGMGDTPVFYRPGSLDFKSVPSLGLK